MTQSASHRTLIDQLVDQLKTGGMLILGAVEDVCWTHSKMRRAGWPGISAYTKVEV